MDQRRKAGGEADVTELSSIPGKRGAAVADPDRLQPGEPAAVPGAAKKIENWSLTSLQQRLVKTRGRLVKHAGYY